MKEFASISSLLAAAVPSGGDRPADDHRQQQLANFWRTLDAPGLHSWPLLFTSGRLVVFADSAAWGNDIRHRAPGLTKALAAHGIEVTAIVVKTRPKSLLPVRKIGQPPRLSPTSARQIEQLADTVNHPALKQSLLKLAKQGTEE